MIEEKKNQVLQQFFSNSFYHAINLFNFFIY